MRYLAKFLPRSRTNMAMLSGSSCTTMTSVAFGLCRWWKSSRMLPPHAVRIPRALFCLHLPHMFRSSFRIFHAADLLHYPCSILSMDNNHFEVLVRNSHSHPGPKFVVDIVPLPDWAKNTRMLDELRGFAVRVAEASDQSPRNKRKRTK